MSDIVTLPIWKKDAPTHERLYELAELAREKPELFQKWVIVYCEDNDKRFKTRLMEGNRYSYFGCSSRSNRWDSDAVGRNTSLSQANRIARRLVLKYHAPKDWIFPLIRVSSAKRGRYYKKTNSISLPEWLWLDTRKGYLEYYIAHELAHSLSGRRDHGMKFQLTLHRLCPRYHFYEIGYKPSLYHRFIREFATTK